jgi:hypothetical protein
MLSKTYLYEQETRLIEEAIIALENKTGLAGRLLTLHPKVDVGYEPDALIELTINGQGQRFIAECKNNIDRKSTINLIHAKLGGLQEPGILIAPYVSREIAEYCLALGLQFMDTHGNAHIRTGGFIYVTGERDTVGRLQVRQAKGTTNTAALRIIFALLSSPGLVNASYRKIVQSTDVSLGAVSATFSDLKERGHMMDPGSSSDRRLLDRRRLLDEWVINYPVVLRPKLNPQRFSAPDPAWWRNVRAENLEAVWGGEVAAERITNYLKPETQTLYVEPSFRRECIKELVTSFRLRPDPKGPVEILDKFWNFSQDQQSDITPSLLVYADLMATLDPRNIEVAQLLLKEIHDAI